MVVIKVLDIVPACNTSEQGAAVARSVRAALSTGQLVTLSFSGVADVPSSFVNSSIVALVLHSNEEIKDRIRIADVNAQIAVMIRRCLTNSEKKDQAA